MVGIGIMELVIIGLIIILPLLLLGIVIALVIAVSSRHRRDAAPHPDVAPCPHCRALVPLRTNTCPECGQPLK